METPTDAGLLSRARRYLADARRGFEHAPVEVALAAAVTLAFSTALEQGGEAMRAWLEVLIVALLMTAAAWTGTLLHAAGAITARRRWTITLAGAVAAGLYGHFVLDLERAAEGWRAVMLLGSALAWTVALPAFAGPAGPAAPAAPAAPASAASGRVRRVGGRLLLRVLGAGLYAAALYAGLALAIGAVNSLFELNLDGTLYGHVFGLVFMLLAPWVIVGSVPELVRPPAVSDVATVVHRMSAFLVPPLLAIYLLILYAYAVRIGVTGEIPRNLVSPMVLAAGVLSAVALLLFDPTPDSPPGRRWLRWAPPLFLPLALLGIYALSIRVAQYGWTEPRLIRLGLLAGMAVLAVAGVVQWRRGRHFTLHAMPLLAAALLAVAAIGPWGAPAVARRDQQARLTAALQEAGVLAADGSPLQREPGERRVAAPLYDRIRETARYLELHHGRTALPAPLLAALDADTLGRNAAGALGLLRERTPEQAPAGGGYATLPPGTPVPLPDGGTAYAVDLNAGGAGRGMDAALTQDGTWLRMRVETAVYSADIAASLAALGVAQDGVEPGTRPRRARQPILEGELARATVIDTAGAARGTLLILNLGADAPEVPGGARRLRHFNGLLILGAQRAATGTPPPP